MPDWDNVTGKPNGNKNSTVSWLIVISENKSVMMMQNDGSYLPLRIIWLIYNYT